MFYKETDGVPDTLMDLCEKMSHEDATINLYELSKLISHVCAKAKKPVVLIIDEVDQASNQKNFLSFLGMLRDKYLKRKKQPTFQSVILSGVYDIKNLKLKIRQDSEHHYNSPWNIAADFTLDMSFSAEDIAGMLAEYEQDYHTGMNRQEIANTIYDYTNGYPFLVSRICKILDEQIPGTTGFETKTDAWTKTGISEAVKMLLTESNTLFDDMVKKLDDFPELRKIIYTILFNGEKIPFNTYNYAINIGCMFGFLKNNQGTVAVSNRIFETQLYNLFISEELLDSKIYKMAVLDRNRFIHEGILDMELVLERFAESFTDIYADADSTFVEENGRRFFLLYLKPIINGTGNYYVEARTRDMRRTDIVVDYRGRQYVLELKIWHGEEYNRRGEKQLLGYLEDYHLTTGYMISFNFNKNKSVGVHRIQIDGRTLIEAVV
jgi:hypothetical protein